VCGLPALPNSLGRTACITQHHLGTLHQPGDFILLLAEARLVQLDLGDALGKLLLKN